MKNQIKAQKNPRNQSSEFNETLAPAMPAPAYRSRLGSKTRLGLGVIWVAAALAGGVGLGLLIRGTTDTALITEDPAPVASAELAVTPAAAISAGTSAIGQAATPASAALTVASATGIAQAQAGNAFATTSVGASQPALSSDALQPGYVHFGHSQGNMGTSPAR